MAVPTCIRLPFLHANLSSVFGYSPPLNFAKYFWPGHEENCGEPFWQADSYPLAPAIAQDFLRQHNAMDALDLERLFLLHNLPDTRQQASLRDELAVLAAFAEDGSSQTEDILKSSLILMQAQKALLWVWLQEETLFDLARLEETCFAKSGNLLQNVLEPDEKAAATENFMPDRSLAPDWRICATNAALFIPVDTVIFVEGPMREDVLENLEFKESPAEFPENFIIAQGPLWRALGKSKSDNRLPSRLAQLYDAERSWLTWSD